MIGIYVFCRSLCAAGCSVDARRVNGQSALMLCVVSRTTRRSPRLLLALLEVLLAAGADPGVREKLRGQTALHALAKLVASDPPSSRDPHLLTALRLLARAASTGSGSGPGSGSGSRFSSGSTLGSGRDGSGPESSAQICSINAQDHRRRTALHHLASRGCSNPEPYQVRRPACLAWPSGLAGLTRLRQCV